MTYTKQQQAGRKRKNKYATLDKWFSRFIRLRDSDENGVFQCISCGKYKNFDKMDAGHLVNRRKLSVRWHPENVNGQCSSCNRFSEGAQANYAMRLGKKVCNDQIWALLSVISNTQKPYTPFDIKALQDHYRKETRRLFDLKSGEFQASHANLVK